MPLYGDPKRVKVSTDDTVPGFLEEKLTAGDSISLTKTGTGADEKIEIAAVVSEVFSTDWSTSTTLQTTSSTTAQDANVSVTVPVDGDYVVFFEGDCRVTNNNGTMALSVSTANTTTELVDSFRAFEGNDRGSCITIQPYTALSAGDVITGLFRKESGSGTAQIRSRSIFLQRIA